MNIIKKSIAILIGTVISFSATALPAINNSLLSASAVYSQTDENDIPLFSTQDEVVEYVRSQMKLRKTTIKFNWKRNYYLGNDLGNYILDNVVEQTGNGDEGDYLRWCFNTYYNKYAYQNNTYEYEMSFDYKTTFEQEQFVTNKINEILGSLELEGKNDYEKICDIYRYVTDNVSYKNGDPINADFTAYGALKNNCAVCQGYSLLMYRLLLEAGISSRVIAGYGNGMNHGWTIAELDGAYYNCDPTWDSSLKTYDYFLKGSKDFDESYDKYSHVRNILDTNGNITGIDYESNEFNIAYPMSEYSFIPTALVLGDINNDSNINAVDASLVLSAYASKSTGNGYRLFSEQLNASNVNCDDDINAVDASAILSYYAYISTGGNINLKDYLN